MNSGLLSGVCGMIFALVESYVTQSRLVVSYRRFGTVYQFNLQGSRRMVLKVGPDRLSRKVGK